MPRFAGPWREPVSRVKDTRLEWARAYGFRDVEAQSRATIETLFQAASISKPVAPAAALHFVDKGLLSLDSDTKFFAVEAPLGLTFVEDDKGNVTGFVTDRQERARKVE